MRRDPLHLAGRLAALLAPQTDADAQDDHGGPLQVRLARVGRPLGHRQGSGQLNFNCLTLDPGIANSNFSDFDLEASTVFAGPVRSFTLTLVFGRRRCSDLQAAGGGCRRASDGRAGLSSSFLQAVPEGRRETLQPQKVIQGECLHESGCGEK